MVTGASRGIGLGAARALGESGARVILVARSAESLKSAAEELGTANIDAKYSAYDLLNTDGIANWFDACVAQFGQLTSW
jgi:short-subunit dehydrogenase